MVCVVLRRGMLVPGTGPPDPAQQEADPPPAHSRIASLLVWSWAIMRGAETGGGRGQVSMVSKAIILLIASHMSNNLKDLDITGPLPNLGGHRGAGSREEGEEKRERVGCMVRGRDLEVRRGAGCKEVKDEEMVYLAQCCTGLERLNVRSAPLSLALSLRLFSVVKIQIQRQRERDSDIDTEVLQTLWASLGVCDAVTCCVWAGRYCKNLTMELLDKHLPEMLPNCQVTLLHVCSCMRVLSELISPPSLH
eukprot:1519663-Rhodomonas_salina.1